MAIHLLTSITGSPGVTTAAIAWARHAPKPTLLIEADMTGGSPILAGPFRGETPPTRTILSLAEFQPHEMAEQIWWHTLPIPETQDRHVLPTISSPAQARALEVSWPAIAQAISAASTETGTDVVIDYGRLTTRYAAQPLLHVADTILVLVPATMAGANAAKRALGTLRDEVAESGSPRRVAVVPVVAPPGRAWWRAGLAARPWNGATIGKILRPVEMLHPIRYDPDAAAVYSAGTVRPFGGTRAYTASVVELANAADAHVRQIQVLAGRGSEH